jgi:DNA-binding NarL/FixJ family response regulator
MVTHRIRVLLVDDHALFRQGLASLLSSQPDIQVVGEAEDGIEAQVKAQELRPDLILMDVTMPGCDGLEATQRIKQALPDARIVMLTVHDEDDRLFEAIRSGAVGYLLKSTAAETLIPMLRGVMRGEAAISGAMAARMLEEFGRLARRTPPLAQPEDVPVLTAREKEVLRLVAAGAMDKEVAAELSVSLSTVKTHMRNILAKLQATSRHQAAAYAMREGLIRPPGRGSVSREK